jgi:hypothetical protein
VGGGEKNFLSLDKVQPACTEGVNSIYTLVRQITYKIRSARPGRRGDSSPPTSWEYSSLALYFTELEGTLIKVTGGLY